MQAARKQFNSSCLFFFFFQLIVRNAKLEILLQVDQLMILVVQLAPYQTTHYQNFLKKFPGRAIARFYVERFVWKKMAGYHCIFLLSQRE